jgi:hypothetical protein
VACLPKTTTKGEAITMANSITTMGMTSGTITTTHKSGESVSQWIGRHNSAVQLGTPGDTLTTKWPCSAGDDSVSTSRLPGENDSDFKSRHESSYLLAMLDCIPVP